MSRSAHLRRLGVRLALLAGLGVLLLPVLGQAEIYKWTDAAGRIYFSQDLGKVPLEHRAAARAAAQVPAARDPIQSYRSQEPRRSVRALNLEPVRNPNHSDHFEIPVRRTSGTMMVDVTLNDGVTAPFVVDTGASVVAIPEHLAARMDLDTSDAREQRFQTANGIIRAPIVTLDSLEVGDVRVEGVEASVNPGLPYGLLGLSFFNHFQYSFDSDRSIVILSTK